jgi:hypothetical protein
MFDSPCPCNQVMKNSLAFGVGDDREHPHITESVSTAGSQLAANNFELQRGIALMPDGRVDGGRLLLLAFGGLDDQYLNGPLRGRQFQPKLLAHRGGDSSRLRVFRSFLIPQKLEIVTIR